MNIEKRTTADVEDERFQTNFPPLKKDKSMICYKRVDNVLTIPREELHQRVIGKEKNAFRSCLVKLTKRIYKLLGEATPWEKKLEFLKNGRVCIDNREYNINDIKLNDLTYKPDFIYKKILEDNPKIECLFSSLVSKTNPETPSK